MQATINSLTCKPKLLLHSCCAPCSTAVLSRLAEHFDLTVFYFNPNIYPQSEFLLRSQEQGKFNNIYKIPLIICDYDELAFLEKVKGLENELEGGARCAVCFKLRLEETAKFAKQNNFDYFCTTLSVSPHKNAALLNKIGEALQDKYGVKYLFSDFKKHDGYKTSIKLSSEYKLYRQNYCGCRFSISE